jgi:hypothetical protein
MPFVMTDIWACTISCLAPHLYELLTPNTQSHNTKKPPSGSGFALEVESFFCGLIYTLPPNMCSYRLKTKSL